MNTSEKAQKLFLSIEALTEDNDNLLKITFFDGEVRNEYMISNSRSSLELTANYEFVTFTGNMGNQATYNLRDDVKSVELIKE